MYRRSIAPSLPHLQPPTTGLLYADSGLSKAITYFRKAVTPTRVRHCYRNGAIRGRDGIEDAIGLYQKAMNSTLHTQVGVRGARRCTFEPVIRKGNPVYQKAARLGSVTAQHTLARAVTRVGRSYVGPMIAQGASLHCRLRSLYPNSLNGDSILLGFLPPRSHRIHSALLAGHFLRGKRSDPIVSPGSCALDDHGRRCF